MRGCERGCMKGCVAPGFLATREQSEEMPLRLPSTSAKWGYLRDATRVG